MNFRKILQYLPEIKKPTEKKLGFNIKIKWTIIILVFYFILSNIPIFGGTAEGLKRFEYLAIIMGTSFGSIITLGIGPIVMASIILQLLIGSKIIKMDINTTEGKRDFQGIQKIGVFFFILFESLVYVLMGGVRAAPGLEALVISQLIIGGFLIVFMDEICHKWGFGSGVSLFIAAGVGWHLFAGLFGFLGPENTIAPIGKIPALFYNFFVVNDVTGGLQALAVILSTLIVFFVIVWAQSLKIEVPLVYDRLRGYGIKWPMAFFYASNIPVILTSAFIANIQLFGGMLQDWLGKPTLLGGFSEGRAISGLSFWFGHTDILSASIDGSLRMLHIWQALTHLIAYLIFATLFSVIWVKTSGMDAQNQARNILKSGLQIPGFRKDERILESILGRYVLPLTVMGGLAIGALAAVSDISGTVTGGTSLLLGIMIMFQLYQNIAQQHAVDMHPAMKKMMGGL